MNAAAQQLAKITMTPRIVARPRMSEQHLLATLSALPAATDEEAGAFSMPPLGLLPADIERLHALSQMWFAAQAAATEAEQRYTSAQRDAAQLPELKRNAGEAAARAYAMNGHGKSLAASTVASIDAAKLAEMALPVLARERDAAKGAASEARGALHGATTEALRAALHRASQHWSVLSLELTRVAASVDSILHALPQRSPTTANMHQGWNACMHKLRVPALPTTEMSLPADRAASDENFSSTLLSGQHGRFAAHVKAASGHLHQQLTEALGFSPSRLLL